MAADGCSGGGGGEDSRLSSTAAGDIDAAAAEERLDPEARADRAAAKEPPHESIGEAAMDKVVVVVDAVVARRSVKSANFFGLPIVRLTRFADALSITSGAAVEAEGDAVDSFSFEFSVDFPSLE